ncbi:MAG: hypothetical protein RMI94_05565 [Bryobacterales bacterium]|nr:hypothetical protein [Bryobacteraceae bacterium]MDW8129998.1 hypothetical protein [Bryobacterales bacterium]
MRGLGPDSAAARALAAQASDWASWWTSLYERDRLLFTLATLGAIVLTGAVLGLLTDALLKRLGIDLTKREMGER